MVARLAFPPVRRVCVYAGSNPGTDRAYAGAARALAGLLAEREIGLVYGGGTWASWACSPTRRSPPAAR